MMDQAQEWREKLVESVCETDEELMMMYLEGEEPTVEQIKATIRKETIEGRMVPVVCGSSYRNKGVQLMLDAVLDYMPSPIDIPDVKGTDEAGNEIERKTSDTEPFASIPSSASTSLLDSSNFLIFILVLLSL